MFPKPNEWVEVRTALEIAATLDKDGALDGMPFMPEMLPFCGKRFRVLRRAEKTCVELPGGSYAIREFINNDVVFLDGLRCAGSGHDGCQRACLLFWKSAWLKPAGQFQAPANHLGANDLLANKLRTKSSPVRYFCQSSQLSKATVARRLSKMQILGKLWRDLAYGGLRIYQIPGFVALPLYRKIRDRIVGRPRLRGTLTATPVGQLNLQPGELVEICDLEKMRQTVDQQGRNRGLVCDIELKKFSGKRYRVRSRLDRMISETTGEMRQVKGTVLLDGNTCMCARVFGGCPREEYCYWREVWLQRVDTQVEPRSNNAVRVVG